MLFPKEMSEVELIVPAKDLVAVTKALSGYGVFHQVDSANLGLESLGPNTWQEKAGAYAALERRTQSILQTVGLPEEYPNRPAIDTMVDMDAVRSVVDRIEDEVKGVSEQLSGERKRLELLESQLRQLEPIADVNVEVGALNKSAFMYSILGIVPAANISRLRTSLLRVPHVFFVLREDAQKPVVWILGPRSNSDILERAAKSAYLNPLSLPDEFTGTPEQISGMLKQEIEAVKEKISSLEADLTRLGVSHKSELQNLLWDVHISRIMADAIIHYGQLRHTYVVVGWVPTADLNNLTTRLKEASREILIETMATSRSGHHSNVPVALTQNKWLKPFQSLVGTYGHPSYGELDPTLLVAFTFPLLYGAMFGDLGQGLLMLVLGLLAHNKIFLKGMQSLGLLFAYCGASAAFFGYLYGSIFGFEGHLIEEYLHFHFEPTWISPMESILNVLSIAIDVGIVILVFSFLLSMFNNIRSRDWAHLLFGHTGITTFLFYLCFLALVFGGFFGSTALAPKIAVALYKLPLPYTILMIVFGVFVTFGGFFRNMVEGHTLIEGTGIGGFGMFLVQSVMDLVETSISMLSNTLSFIRVGAFAVAHGGLSLAIFALAGEEPTLGFWVTIAIGNLFIIGFEGLIVYIQTMRLHYYEILGKFFHGGGMQFEPLKLSPSKEEA
ncbi:MAG TPA: V-type ATPase 116kDa subunit family protein [Anaerolineales bacterium]|nr:V-type ATPase 116kDa subunit family protein [Anaerolineales bacterium]